MRLLSSSAAALLLTSTAYAVDTGATAAALKKDEAVECRPVLRLCEEARQAERLHRVTEERAMTAHDRLGAPGYSSLPPEQAKDLLDEAEDASITLEATRVFSANASGALHTAVAVLRAKHDRASSCIRQCPLLSGEQWK